MFYTDISIYVEGSFFFGGIPSTIPQMPGASTHEAKGIRVKTVASVGRVVVVKQDIYIYDC